MTYNIKDPIHLLSLYFKDFREGKKSLYPWQLKFHLAFAAQRTDKVIRIATVANNGSGKSQFLIAPAACWLGMAFERARAVITSASGQQLDRQIIQSLDHICQQINEIHAKVVWEIKYRFYRNTETGSTIELFATDDPGLAEGYHPHTGGSEEFALFCDEAKSIPEPIYQALERCNGMTRRVSVSSPGSPKGHFFDILTNTKSPWIKFKVTYKDCAHIKDDEVQEAIRLYKKESPFFRSAYLAEFTSVDEQTVIGWHTYKESRLVLPPQYKNGQKFAGIDLARGGDENAMSVWHGNVEIGLETFRIDDTMRTADLLKHLIEDKYQIPAEQVNVDDGNVGHSIIDRLWDMGVMVNRVVFGAGAISKKMYGNRGTELWFRFAQMLPDLHLIDDEICESQLVNRYYKINDRSGQILLESKQQARAKGHPSPDRADARVLAFAGRNHETFITDLVEETKPKEKKIEIFSGKMSDLEAQRLDFRTKFGEIKLGQDESPRYVSPLHAYQNL